MVSKPALGSLGLLFLSGALLLMFFVILAGVTDSTPLNKIYFLQADTSGITGARNTSRWLYFYVCNERNQNCWGAWPAPPFGWAWSRAAANVPDGLGGSHGRGTTSFYYFYMWRFGWVFYLMSLFFVALAWFGAWLACCGRLGSAIASLLSFIGLFFFTIAVSLMTATFVRARNAFQNAGRSASLGRYAFGFSWAAWACILIACLLFCIGIRGDRRGQKSSGTGRGWGRRRARSTRSRRSYDLGSRRVKDDYS